MKRESPSRFGRTLSEGEFVDRAVRAAAQDALKRHKRAGVPLTYYRNGTVVTISASILARRHNRPKPR